MALPQDPNDWVALVKAIPGAAKALTELIGEFGHLGTQWLRIGTVKAKQISGGIEVKTKAAMAEGDVKVALIKANGQTLVAGARTHRLSLESKKQENREEVARLTIENIVQDPPQDIPGGSPSDDWLNLLGHMRRKLVLRPCENTGQGY